MTDLLSLRAAAALLGMQGGHPRDRARRLQRYLFAIEARDGVKLLVRAGGKGAGTRWVVSLEALRDAVPELFSRRDEIVEAVKQELAEVRERLEDVVDRGDLIADHVVTLSERVSKLEARRGAA